MGQIPLHEKPTFRTLVFSILLAALYVYYFVWQGGVAANLAGIVLDLILLLLFLPVCVFFYAQFILPVRTLEDRKKIAGRLVLHARRAHGPATFVQNGRKVERAGEGGKAGPGLLWIDTASAVVTRSAAGLKRVLGPGIHFIDEDERIASTFSLHRQTCSIGPGQAEPIFEKPGDNASDQELKAYAQLQTKRMAVSARTRDGNEVVPQINVVFKLDARPANPGAPGSRFGFMAEAVERAARAEGVNPTAEDEQPLHVPWNQLPGLIAADIWREYLGKFTLDELFSPVFPGLPEVLQPEEAVPSGILPSIPFVVRRNFPARLLRRLNNSIEKSLDAARIVEDSQPDGQFAQRPVTSGMARAAQPYTALQIIASMMKARMTQAVVPILDDCGRLVKGHVPSEEYKKLNERGLLILGVNIGGLRFDPAVEEQIVQQWKTSWLANAQDNRRQVEQLELLAVQAGRQKALLEHATALAQAIRSEEPRTISSAVRTLLQSTQREILTDERLYGRAGNEVEALSQLLKWMESSNHE